MINKQTNETIEVPVNIMLLTLIVQFNVLEILVFLYFSVIAQFLIHYTQLYFSNIVGQNVVYNLRNDLYKHLLRIEYNYFEKIPLVRLLQELYMIPKICQTF